MIQMMLFIVCLLLFAACEKEIEKHNERPDFLKGNAWEVLADRGNYQLFRKVPNWRVSGMYWREKGYVRCLLPTMKL